MPAYRALFPKIQGGFGRLHRGLVPHVPPLSRYLHLPATSAIEMAGDVPPVKFIGVWDTVGALGIPLGALGSIFNRDNLV